jgi:hypothetical protein
MLDPAHTCSWTAQRRTELTWHAGVLAGAGVSLRVLLAAWPGEGYHWFSRIYGDYADNLVVLAVAAADAAAWPQTLYDVPGPVAQAALPPASYAEFELTRELLIELGCWPHLPDAPEEEQFAYACTALLDHHDQRVKLTLALHDDCFFTLRPVTPEQLCGLIAPILAMHSFWLKQSINWSTTPIRLADRLREQGELHLTSEDAPPQLVVRWPNRAGFVQRLLQPRIEETATITNGHAVWPDETSHTP